MFIDVHCHLDYDSYGEDIYNIISEMKEKNIIAWTNTTCPENYQKAKLKFKDYSDTVKICAGLYPQDAEKINDKDFNNYIKLIKKEKNQIVAIGEVGLDFHNSSEQTQFDIQEKRFRQLIELAIKLDKPMLIHARKAELKVLEILEEYVTKTGFRKFDLHCFMGKKKYIKKIIELKIYCSIPAILKTTESFQILVKELPMNQILVETDSPFLHPDRKQNSPLIIPDIYKQIAQIKGYNDFEIENIIYRNFTRFIL
ncbi:MAG: TatD family hydrolase [Nanoarchaeales archaeon]|nr:TatD family hydrolase [Nanoarchaeales archaeon]